MSQQNSGRTRPYPKCLYCGQPVDQGLHTLVSTGGGMDPSGVPFASEQWRCDEPPRPVFEEQPDGHTRVRVR